MKKIFLCVVLLLCAVIGNATAIWNGNGQGTASSPYEIWNLDRLNEVRNFVGDEGVGKYFRLEKDLDLSEYLEGLSWEPIGSSAEPFKGVFLGNGKKITGMTINGSSNYQGFFGCISGATIQDLTIEGSVTGAGYVGGIVGSSSGTSTIKNCTFNGNVTGSGSYVGGIVGSFAGTLNNVTHTGTTKGAGYVGGIVGQHTSGSMTTATNTGNVTATSSSYAGGIVGYSSVAISSANSVGTVTGKQYTGGLAGISNTVNNSSADGPVTGTNYTGGLVGQSNGTISGCSAKGKVTGQQYTGGLIGYCTLDVSNSRHSNGAVNGTNYVGGLVGNLASGSVTSCYVYANITGTDNVGGIVGCYTLSNGNSPQINSSGYFGNISARQYVGGILGQIKYSGSVQSGNVTMPTLHTYKTYGVNTTADKTYQETVAETNNVVSIKNCAVVGDVIGTSFYVGGILGKGVGGEYLSSTENTASYTRYNSNHNKSQSEQLGDYTYYTVYYYKDGSQKSAVYHTGQSVPTFTYYTYTYSSVKASLTDNYFSGNLKGTDYVGGVVGNMQGGTISRNYSYAAIEGSNTVGGIVGYMQASFSNFTNILSCNVALNSTVTATSQAGKVYGYTTGSNLTIATTGTNINKTLNTTSLVIGGVTQETSNDAQNGTLQTQRMLLQSTAYSGLGWNFDSGAEWTSEESVSYPYKQWQTAPPTIKSGAVKGSTTLSGKCTDNGTVYVTIEGNSTVYEATCSGGNWSLTVPALKSGTLIRAWSKIANKEQSYQTSTTVSAPGGGTENDPWLIYDAYDLAGVAKAGYYKMMNDVNLTSWISANSSSTGWPGVGSNGTGSIYFDGNNKKVTGIWCNTTTSQNGLFSYLENANIKDLTVEVASGKQMTSSGNYIAILAGQLKNSTVTNVTVKGTVGGNGTFVAGLIAYSTGNTISECKVVDCIVNSSNIYYVAGMVASSNNDNISNCSVNATINTTGSNSSMCPVRGGVVGDLDGGTITDCSFNGTITTSESGAEVGGIVGSASNASITKCQADVTITSTGADTYAGGLVGYSSSNSSVSLCFTEGTVVASGDNTYSAGLVGYTDTTSPVENCMSTVNVTGTGYVGGIVGYTTGSVKKCVAKGSLLNSSDDGRAGGIVGFIEESAASIKGNVGWNTRIETGSNQWGWRIIGGRGNNITYHETTDNYGFDQMPILRNNQPKTVEDMPDEGTAKTTEELQQQSTYEALEWDFTDIWTMSSQTHMPILQWLATSAVMKGDLNDDGEVSITDVVLIIDVIAEVITDADKVAAADVNDDGAVTITDCVAAIDLIAAQQSNAARRATDNGQPSMANVQWSTTDFISASMQGNLLNVALDNERSYTAFQMVVSVPEGMTLDKAKMDKMRGEDHQAVVCDLGNGQYLVAGFSMDNDVLAGNSGRLFSIVTNGQATGDIIINNVEFATADAEGYRLAGAVVSSTTTDISETVNSKSSNSKWFDLQGRRVAAPAKGLYIVNGKKINLK